MLIQNWKIIALKAWSFRLAILTGLASAYQGYIDYVASGQPPVVASLIALSSFATALSRIMAQPDIAHAFIAEAIDSAK